MITLCSIRERPELAEQAIEWFCAHWASEQSRKVYENCILLSLHTAQPLPQWYLLMDGARIAGGAGLITNDFISRMDLCPWLCALFIEPDYRGHRYGGMLLDRARRDAGAAGFAHLYLCTDLNGYYEKFGGEYIGVGYHPWGESSKIYRFDTISHEENPHSAPSETAPSEPEPPTSAPVEYAALTEHNFHADSLDHFVRHQEVAECWRRIGGELALVPVSFTEEWNPAELRQMAALILDGIRQGWYACAAFCQGEVVGYLLLRSDLFGSRRQYMELKEFYVSAPHRQKGIGGRLFRMGAEHAARAGAQKLYISAHSSRESQAAYRKLGCAEAEEPDRALAEREPCDVQMEYDLSRLKNRQETGSGQTNDRSQL